MRYFVVTVAAVGLTGLEERLPEILPEAGESVEWADDRRALFEVRSLLSTGRCRLVRLPAGVPGSGAV